MDDGVWWEVARILLAIGVGLSLLLLLLSCYERRRARRAASAAIGDDPAPPGPPSGHAPSDGHSRVPFSGHDRLAPDATGRHSPTSLGGRSPDGRRAASPRGRRPMLPSDPDPLADAGGLWSFWGGLRSTTSGSGSGTEALDDGRDLELGVPPAPLDGRSAPADDTTAGRGPTPHDNPDPLAATGGLWSFWTELGSSASSAEVLVDGRDSEPSASPAPLGGHSPPADVVIGGRSHALPGSPPVAAGGLWSFWRESQPSTSSSGSED